MYSSQIDVLNTIKDFIGFGNIYLKKETGVLELTITKKEDVKTFLKNIKDKIITKKAQIDYLLANYNFDKGITNSDFDVDKFRSFITRKNMDNIRKLHTIKNESQEPI